MEHNEARSFSYSKSSYLSTKEAKSVLKTRVAGFSKNSGDNPYLLDETLRVALFPGAPVTAVVPSQQAKPILQKIRNTVATLGGRATSPRH